jgi:hypothetical protein
MSILEYNAIGISFLLINFNKTVLYPKIQRKGNKKKEINKKKGTSEDTPCF